MNTIILPRVADFSVSLSKSTQHRATILNTWIERLAVWAERQPPHRHLGSWTAL